MYRKLIHSGDLLELYEYEREPVLAPKRPKTCRHKECRSKRVCIAFRPKFRLNRNTRRARRQFYRLVRANCAHKPTFLLTCTMLSVCSLSVAYTLFTRFMVRLRRLGYSFEYVAVPEFQKRGAVHFHCLVFCSGSFSDLLVNERYSRRIQRQWGFGFLDVMATDGSPKLAGYLAKYLTKTMSDSRVQFKKSYCSSRGLVRPVSLSSSKMPTAMAIVLEDFGVVDNSAVLVSDRSYNTKYLGMGRTRVYSLKK